MPDSATDPSVRSPLERAVSIARRSMFVADLPVGDGRRRLFERTIVDALNDGIADAGIEAADLAMSELTEAEARRRRARHRWMARVMLAGSISLLTPSAAWLMSWLLGMSSNTRNVIRHMVAPQALPSRFDGTSVAIVLAAAAGVFLYLMSKHQRRAERFVTPLEELPEAAAALGQAYCSRLARQYVARAFSTRGALYGVDAWAIDHLFAAEERRNGGAGAAHAADELREIQPLDDLSPVTVMTAQVLDEDRERARAAGASSEDATTVAMPTSDPADTTAAAGEPSPDDHAVAR